jgi:hypothetical protein
VSFGNGGPQRKLACNASSLTESDDCVVISVGSENEWIFEQDVVRTTRCRVEVFDCTSWAARASPGGTAPTYARSIWSVPKHLASRVTLHNICLGTPQYRMLPKNVPIKQGVRSLGWPEMLMKVGLNRSVPALLKIDCEGCEVEVFRELMRHQMLLPPQIAVELHFPYNPTLAGSPAAATTVWQKRFADLHRQWPVEEMLQTMHEQAGYTVASALPGTDVYSYCCSEVLLVRTPDGC